jgi:two-component system phosphate regulon sensor histidine kinase PhoR
MLRSRTFWQLFGACAAPVLLAVILLGSMVVERTKHNELKQIEEKLHEYALLVQEIIPAGPIDNSLANRLQALDRKLGMCITLIGKDGTVLLDTREDPKHMDNHASRKEIEDALATGFGLAARRSATVGESMMYAALATGEKASDVRYVRVAFPLAAVEETVAELTWHVWSAAGLATLVALGLAFWLARRHTGPLQELTTGAEEIAAGGFGHRVPPRGNNEVGQLTRTFNYMSERLADQFAQLEEDRQQLRAVLSSMVEGVVALDNEQRVLFANERAGQLLDFPTQAAVGRHLGELVRQRALQDIVQRALGDPGLHREELTWHGPGPRSVAVHVGRFPGTPPRGIVLVLHDTSDLRRLERLRQEFVANVSHELKTPLSVITACVETLIDGAVEDQENRGRFLERIAEQAERLNYLILDLLSLARIESETEAFTLQAVSLEKVVAACLERHRTLADAKNQLLETQQPPAPVAPANAAGTLPVLAWADDEAVRQILDNLVDNALKYTPSGGTIRVRWGQDGEHVFLQVEDTGIGIPEAELPRVFERFYRVDKARSRELGGTGLGLSIVKHLAQAMQGSVSARSKLGIGSTFTVRLPADRRELRSEVRGEGRVV